MRYEPFPGWREELWTMTDRLFLTYLGPAITASAKAYCPVLGGPRPPSTANETTLSIAASMGIPLPDGQLRDSIEYHLRLHTLIVRATGSQDRWYAYWVETGHRIIIFGYDTGRTKPPSPFLRPALYQMRLAG